MSGKESAQGWLTAQPGALREQANTQGKDAGPPEVCFSSPSEACGEAAGEGALSAPAATLARQTRRQGSSR